MVTGDRGAQIVDLGAARAMRLGRAIGRVLERGLAIAATSSDGNVDEWRSAARAIASARGWRVRTGVTPDGSHVWAVRLDRETTDEDRALLRDRLGYLGAVLGHP